MADGWSGGIVRTWVVSGALAAALAAAGGSGERFVWPVPAQAQERDPGVTAMINDLANQFESAAWRALDQETKDEYRLALVTSLVKNIREGTCREVIFGVHKDGHDLRTHADLCRINDNFVEAPEHLRVKP